MKKVLLFLLLLPFTVFGQKVIPMVKPPISWSMAGTGGTSNSSIGYFYAQYGWEIGNTLWTVTDIQREADSLLITVNDTSFYKLIGDSSLAYTDRTIIYPPSTLTDASYGISIHTNTTKTQYITEDTDTLDWNVGGWLFEIKPPVASGVPSFLTSDGDTWAWYIYSESATITQVGGLVSEWADYLGSGNDLLQAGVDYYKPTLTADGILFDGVSKFLRTANIALDQPEMIYMVLRQVTWTASDIIFDGYNGETGEVIDLTNTPEIKGKTSVTISGANANLAVNTWAILRVIFDGESSKVQVDATAVVTWDGGTDDEEGFTLGRGGVGHPESTSSNIEVKEVIIRKVADTAPNETLVYAYLKTRYGL